MKLITGDITELFAEAVKKMDPEFSDWGKLFIQSASNEKFGDYQTNFAMTVAKVFRKAPRQIAEEIIDNFPENEIVEKLEIAGPGFINIFLDKNFISSVLKKIETEKWTFDHLNTKGDVVIDYSSPNIAKPMHAGHLRTTILGDSLKRIMRFAGYRVIADNHLGDWGTQFGKLIIGYRNWLDKGAFKEDPINELERIYIKFTEEAENNPELSDEARTELGKLQNGDPENTKLWELFSDITKKECKRIYSRLGIEFDTYYGESFYHPMMPEVVKLLEEKKVAVVDNDALVVFFDEDENLHPCIIRKKDGTFLYSTSDLATVKFKKENYDLNKAVYVTDDRQTTHFKQVFSICKKMGWNVNFAHVTFGIMSFNGQILSTRAGNTIKLDDLLDEAQKRAYEIVNEKNPDLPEDEKKNIARVVGIGALKYSDLSQNRTSNIDFSWNKALSFEGNTAPYLQYSYARVCSIFRKAEKNNITIENNSEITLETEGEKQLAMSVIKFPEIVEKAAETYKPNLLADHIFDLAQKFSSFYNSTPILKSEKKLVSSRLKLSKAVAETIRTGLDLLGIEVVKRM